MNGIGILPGHHQSYIDHLVPLCQIMEVPLLVTDPHIQALIEAFYPPMQIIFADPADYDLDAALQGYDLFFYVDFFRHGNGSFQFQDYLSHRQARSVMSLHGNPDKYWQNYWLERLADEDIVLAYGPQLVEILQKKCVPKKPIVTGNYRLEFYDAHASFFDSKIKFSKEKTTILYAPTWTCLGRTTAYRDHYSTFFDVYKRVFETLADRYQLIVKLHPHLYKTMPDTVEAIAHEYPHIYFLQDFPLIYPLLKQIDLYLGDYSSIGYDFLYYDRPLFFLETQEPTALQAYGHRLRVDDLPALVEKYYARKELYQYVYGDRKALSELKGEIEDACRSHPC